MRKIEMLDDFGKVTEVCEATMSPLAVGPDDVGAYCEDGNNPKARENCAGPVYSWTAKDGMTFQACRAHIERDDFSRFLRSNPKLLEIAEALRVIQSDINAAEFAPKLAQSWITWQVEHGAWGHLDKAMVQIIAEMNTGHTPDDILELVYDSGESIACCIKWLDDHSE